MPLARRHVLFRRDSISLLLLDTSRGDSFANVTQRLKNSPFGHNSVGPPKPASTIRLQSGVDGICDPSRFGGSTSDLLPVAGSHGIFWCQP